MLTSATGRSSSRGPDTAEGTVVVVVAAANAAAGSLGESSSLHEIMPGSLAPFPGEGSRMRVMGDDSGTRHACERIEVKIRASEQSHGLQKQRKKGGQPGYHFLPCKSMCPAQTINQDSTQTMTPKTRYHLQPRIQTLNILTCVADAASPSRPLKARICAVSVSPTRTSTRDSPLLTASRSERADTRVALRLFDSH